MANFHSINGNEVEAHYAGGDLRNEIDSKANTNGYYTTLAAGAADALMGDPSESTWLRRTSTGSGAARVESVQGAAEVQDGELVPVRIAGIASTDAQGGELDGVEWPAQTLRAAGSVADMLYSDHVDVRVGAYTFTGSETASVQNWRPADTTYGAVFPLSMISDRSSRKYENNRYSAAVMADLDNQTYGHLFDGIQTGFTMATDATDTRYSFIVRVPKTIASTQAELMSWLAGKTVWYELATPATTPISPTLPMTYRVEQGGTESIIVPSGEVSAAPVLTVADGESAADLVMDALTCIATPDGPTATANHAANTYLTMQGKLYKVTSAIASGEQIVSGTNVTETTVMDGSSYELPPATASTLGGVKVGSGLSVAADGTLSSDVDTGMAILEYGVSTWADLIEAITANRLVYCRVGQRMAFLAYLGGAAPIPTTLAEFQYYRSVSSHTDAQQGDEIYIYTLKSDNTWTTTTRQAYTRIVAGTGLKSTYANGVLTISLDQ